ncbi:MAG: ribonuclease H-like domain-containing protein [Deltaproteobacteria bacterium]|jgi:uncharacterized protein YprB with RNaseH-like and TPR domain|nr:ribonuclease H-like domain-containing protein [Deltaproteobacteria bacterium]
MLKSTFIHLPGVSVVKEKKLWAEGILTWEDLLKSPIPFSDDHNWYHESLKAYQSGDAAYFGARLDNGDHWRVAASYPTEVMFLDIETTGFANYSMVTIIGWSIGGEFKVLVNGRDDPREFLADLARAKALVTFNGRAFDLRFLKALFSPERFTHCHADLMYLCRKLGLSGGQKAIEKALNLDREVSGDGYEAAILWYKYHERGKTLARQRALRDLIVYNHADVEGLKVIFDACLLFLAKEGRPVPTNLFAPLATSPDFTDLNNFPFSLELM